MLSVNPHHLSWVPHRCVTVHSLWMYLLCV